MVKRQPLIEDMIRTAVGPTSDCPATEELESFASGEAGAVKRWSGHLQSCAYCKTELHLLHTFVKGEVGEGASKAVKLLEKKSKHILKQAFPAPKREPWWRLAFSARQAAFAMMATAAILLATGVVIFLRSSTYSPQMEARNQVGPEVLRSTAFNIVSPAGDLQERPKEIRWEPVPQATAYQVRLLEVDRTELWKASTSSDHVELPAVIQDRIVPSKTLFAEITAFDSSGSAVATTGLVHFRLEPKSK